MSTVDDTLELEKQKQVKREYNRKYYAANKERMQASNRAYREANKEVIDRQRHEYRRRPHVQERVSRKNREYLPKKKAQIAARRLVDENFRIAEVLRSKVHKMLKGINTTFVDLLGMSIEDFRSWIAFQFDDGMSWDNFGKVWQIDHVLPMSRFDLTVESERAVCFGWTNLQPLLASENRAKSNRIFAHHFCNSLVTAHRYIRCRQLDRSEYQRLRESVAWLRAKIAGTVTSSWMTEGF